MNSFFKRFFLIIVLLFAPLEMIFALSTGLALSDWHAEELPDHTIRLSVTLPDGAHATADMFGPLDVSPIQSPPVQILRNDLTERDEPTFTAGILTWILPSQTSSAVRVHWQVCIGEMCYMPDQGDVPIVHLDGSMAAVADVSESSPESLSLRFGPYELIRSADGFLPADRFSAFLRGNLSSTDSIFEGHGFFVMLLLSVLGGIALNLTPCVLPLLPVNLAMIGAGSDSNESRHGKIWRGVAYGAGIALTYGALGIFSVLLGSTFGGIDSHWLFNAFVALIFVVLALAMFDLFSIDFSRIGEKLPMPENTHLIGIALMGALSAIIAGACVAPVLVAALLQAAKMVAHGNYAGLVLPFALGVGMALPWPVVAAGISFLPAPGRWMVRVKQGLGVLILLLAAYYAVLAVNLYRRAPEMGDSSDAANTQASGMTVLLRDAFARAIDSKRDVLIDFTAEWCKNCKTMELTVFQNPDVARLMESFVVVQLHADFPSEPETAAVLREFGVKGLPAFRIVRPVPLDGGSLPTNGLEVVP